MLLIIIIELFLKKNFSQQKDSSDTARSLAGFFVRHIDESFCAKHRGAIFSRLSHFYKLEPRREKLRDFFHLAFIPFSQILTIHFGEIFFHSIEKGL